MPSSAIKLSALKSRPADSVLVVKTVVGEVAPVYPHALQLRREVLCKELHVPEAKDLDGLDAVSIHFVTYLNLTLMEHYQRQGMLEARLANAAGITVHFRDEAVPPLVGESADLSLASASGAGYKPPKLVPVGTLRLRRSANCSKLGVLNMMVAEVSRLCVLPQYRHYGIGDVLMAEAVKVTRSAVHVPYLVLNAQVSTVAFYKRLGFMPRSEEFEQDGKRCVVMVKEVKDEPKASL